MSDIRYIVRNAIQTPDGTILESNHRHDYKTYVDKITGETYMVDGGLAYLRSNANKVPAKDLYVYHDDDHLKIRDSFKWGTYGKDGKDKLKRVLLRDMTANHIKAILKTQIQIPNWMVHIFNDELDWRREE